MKLIARLGVSNGAVIALSILTGATGLTAALAFLTQLLLARGLQPDAYGSLAMVLATVAVAGPIASFGIGKYWLRVFGAEGWAAIRWIRPSLISLALSTSAAMALILLWASFADVDPSVRRLAVILAPTVVIYSLSEVAYARFQLEEAYKALAFWQMAPNLGRASVALLAVALSLNVVQVAIGLTVVSGLICVMFLTATLQLARHRISLAGHVWTPEAPNSGPPVSVVDVFRYAWPFGLAGVFYLVYFQSDVLLLGWLSSSYAAGIYNVAFTVMAAVYLLPSIFHQKYLLPKVHRWAEHDPERFLRVLRLGAAASLAVGIVVMVAVMVVAPWLVTLLFGPDYAPAGSALLVLALSIPARYLATGVGAALVTSDHMQRKVRVMGVSALVNVAANLVLIPRFDIMGAAASTVFSEFALLAGYLYLVRFHVVGPDAFRGWRRPSLRTGKGK